MNMQECRFMWRETSLQRELFYPEDELNTVGIKIQNLFAKISAIKWSPHVIAPNRKPGPTVLSVSKDKSAALPQQTGKEKSHYEILVNMSWDISSLQKLSRLSVLP